MPSAVDFDGAGQGVCLIWHISYENGLTGLMMGNNATTDLMGTFSLSNSISVTRNQPEGGTLTGGPFTFTVDDGNADMIPAGGITLTGNAGASSQWVVTDDQGIILGLPPMPSVVDFDGAGPGTCLIWHLSYDGTLNGLDVGSNANDLEGCSSLSNPISVERISATGCQANGGELFGGPFSFTVGDGLRDTIAAGSIVVANAQGDTTRWIVTDDQGIILGLPPMPSVVDFDGAGPGTCLIWHLSYNGPISGLEAGLNANELDGCFNLSNAVEVERIAADGCQANGGTLFGGPFEFCVGDGVADNIPAGSITLANSQGMNSQWVVTDDQGMILGLPPMPSAVDFDGAGFGTCLIWHLSYDGSITGLMMGSNAADLQGCFTLSNSIAVNRIDCSSPNTSDIVINEVGDGRVEFKNLGSSSIDISNYWVCNFPAYDRIGTLNIVCGGDYILDPNELVTVDLEFTIDSNDGEFGLYSTNDFGNASAILDYVEWGSTGHGRSGLAVTAGIWTTGDFVSAFSNTKVLEYDGSGDSSSDWNEDDATPCNENSFNEPSSEKSTLKLQVYPNPSTEFIQLSSEQEFIYNADYRIHLLDSNGKQVYFSSENKESIKSKRIDVRDFIPGTYYLKVIGGGTNTITKVLIL